jgi:predicted transcriptional regulator
MAEVVTTKKCSACKKTKPVSRDRKTSQFYPYRDYACGRPTWRYKPRCRPCQCRHEYERFKDKHKRTAPKKLSESERKLRQSARHMLGNAVYMRRVKKPSRCQRCAKLTQKADLHGHHTDYRMAYDVEWLCRGCHLKETA